MVFRELKSKLFDKKSSKIDTKDSSGKGLVIFNVVEEAIKAEKVVKKANYPCKLVAPPPSLRKGCDLALEINLVEQPVIERVLTSKVPYVGVSPLKGTTELLQMVKITYFEDYTMVKAGNMKITFENNTGLIVNTSGGGCPDIPYLNLQMVGKKLNEVTRPKEIGYTLCALMLDRAYEEALSLWEGGNNHAVNSRNNSEVRSSVG
jgi:hypothetical protein